MVDSADHKAIYLCIMKTQTVRWFLSGCSAAVALFLISGCATPYRPAHGGKGYADSQVSADQFNVGFQGNGDTSPQKANDYALLRGAQVTLQHGFGYFAVIDITNTGSARPYVQRQRFYSDYPPNMGLPPPALGGYDPYRFGYIVEYSQPRVYYRPGVRFLIKCFQRKPDKPFTYDAAALERLLKERYRIS
jgi:hypothetical protein